MPIRPNSLSVPEYVVGDAPVIHYEIPELEVCSQRYEYCRQDLRWELFNADSMLLRRSTPRGGKRGLQMVGCLPG